MPYLDREKRWIICPIYNLFYQVIWLTFQQSNGNFIVEVLKCNLCNLGLLFKESGSHPVALFLLYSYSVSNVKNTIFAGKSQEISQAITRFSLSYIYVGQKEVYTGASDFDIKHQLDYDSKLLSATAAQSFIQPGFEESPQLEAPQLLWAKSAWLAWKLESFSFKFNVNLCDFSLCSLPLSFQPYSAARAWIYLLGDLLKGKGGLLSGPPESYSFPVLSQHRVP